MPEVVLLFRALADEHRQRILEALNEVEELCVSDLVEVMEHVSQQMISHHLQVLKQCRLVGARRRGKFVYYQLNRQALEEAVETFFVQFRA